MAELNALGHAAEMQTGQNGQFDVVADDVVVFSKARTGHFPELAELIPVLPAA